MEHPVLVQHHQDHAATTVFIIVLQLFAAQKHHAQQILIAEITSAVAINTALAEALAALLIAIAHHSRIKMKGDFAMRVVDLTAGTVIPELVLIM
jgi:Ca2+/Na+ antiporter